MDGTTLSRVDSLRLRYGWGFENSDLEFYGFTSGRPAREGERYLGYRWFRYQVREALNSKWARSVTEDKWIFSRLADSLALPAPQTYGLYHPSHGTTWDLQ